MNTLPCISLTAVGRTPRADGPMETWRSYAGTERITVPITKVYTPLTAGRSSFLFMDDDFAMYTNRDRPFYPGL
jgi:hypothetical protein